MSTPTAPKTPIVLLQSACQEHDDQDEKNDPSKTSPDSRATQVETAPAEQQQQDEQHNQQVHNALLSWLRMRSPSHHETVTFMQGSRG
jgi:hypothetical protein